MSDSPDTPTDESRALRLARSRHWRRRGAIAALVIVLVVGAGVGAYALVAADSSTTQSASASGPPDAPAPPPTRAKAAPTTHSTTSTTLPALKQPAWAKLPSPGAGIGWGSRGPVVLAYEARMKALHFDPGPVDGVFDQQTEYAVVSVQKYYNLPRTGRIDAAVQSALQTFSYSPSVPNGDRDRVEIDLDRQVLTLFKNGQPVLLTTTSTGSGEYFCGGVDGCQYAITQTGHFHFYDLIRGWQKGKLGTMWNPFYFNGSDAVHGLDSVPPYPASHGCARIPMHIADYFYTLVWKGMSVYVVGHAKQPGNQYVGPVKTPPAPASTTTTVPVKSAGGKVTTTTAAKPKNPAKKPHPPTTKTTPTTVKKKP